MSDGNDKPKKDDWEMTNPLPPLEKYKSAADFSEDSAPKPVSANQSSATDRAAQQNFDSSNNEPSFHSAKTIPNINFSPDIRQDENPPSQNQSSPDDWGMSAPKVSLRREEAIDDSAITLPNVGLPQAQSKTDDWAMTAPKVNAPKTEKPDDWSMPAPVFRRSEGEKVGNLPKRSLNSNQSKADNYDKTAPNFNSSKALPPYDAASPNFNLRAQPNIYESISANQSARTTRKTEEASGSKLIYVLGGLIALLLFGVVALAGIYFLFLKKPETGRQFEALKEEPKETMSASAPVAAGPQAETALPNKIDYHGAMVLVSAGEFTMGSDADDDESKPAHRVTLPAFYIDKTEVTNAQYKKFCDETGKSYPPDPHLEKDFFTSRPDAPVVGVSFSEAREYAAWAGKRLPTEAEWEKAASWDVAARRKRQFPWGDDFQKNNVAFGTGAISDVGKFSGGASACGALDMAGNVLEWVDAFFQPYPNGASTNAEFGEKNRVARGGHFGSKTNDSLKTTKRIYVSPDIASGEDDEKLVAAIIGFRCAVSADDSRVKEVLRAQSK